MLDATVNTVLSKTKGNVISECFAGGSVTYHTAAGASECWHIGRMDWLYRDCTYLLLSESCSPYSVGEHSLEHCFGV